MNGTARTANGVGGPMHQYGGPSKRTKAVAVEEDATKLQFGDFADGEALTPMDVKTVLEAVRSAPGAPPAPDNKVYKAASEYINQFSNASTEMVESMRTALSARPGFLNKFEIAQIMYLRPSTLIEAVTLIPSLERYHNGDEDQRILEQLLEDIKLMARYNSRA
ncbi:HRDC-like protein [Kockovaella imperatae]|uniref:HRDC-like protein n=1 Tax=Kockovaella imperatae TaxID=4999 RepID=A0A1Y1UUN0_9TREE|nr:HRDC-like protein [Kockovaella imperatae]ORX40905.1 HRDC-like protein [Kockovaella imperatae]